MDDNESRRIWALAEQVDQVLPVLAVKLVHFVKDFPVPDVTLPQAFLLHHLRHHGPCTASTIADLLGVTSGPVTSLTKRLIQRGLLHRRPDEKDGRVVWFSLTEAGEALADTLSRHSTERWAAVIRQVGEDRARTALEIMGNTIRVLDGLQGEPSR
ncbi:MarR family winged helix-turn-helix transcriptional regulator [Alicyclobacillus macrosporangiidus]|uniref:DNA-binding transcriptional regulator, MarR family n=1 Tax=Alicyclobacillus macrosporangiidus TaxID=392015 RepID=A0A1I7FDQ8_9BACL|nr:MarR family transcriptional regulator [Alicyclobacillus macrosporangiidus]SFU34373.1 DNA-binding transcriptional regulator, MarR family [Alicyclobacillus macrosporangiidus]